MNNRRKAFTLAELLAVMTVGSVMTGIAAIMLAGLFRAESASRRHLQYESAACSLGEQFRRDVRWGVAVEDLEEGKWRIRISPQENIVYESLPGEIIRTHSKSNAATAYESFNLWPESTATLKIEKGDRSLVVLTINAKNDRTLSVEAVLGADNRFIEEPEL